MQQWKGHEYEVEWLLFGMGGRAKVSKYPLEGMCEESVGEEEGGCRLG